MRLEDKVNQLVEQRQLIKLHLGCGNRIFDGYLNVEGEYMKGTPNIYLHDLLEPFKFADNLVSEILSVHVIEHIVPDKVPDLFKEWHRILKPGGFVATEWPDLLKMCKFLVEDPTRIYSKDRRVLKRGVAGIFGNVARYQDPVMLHKWGYSQDSMAVLFKEAGFSKVVYQDPVYPKTQMCSRVVAYK